jgi:hypothetical protein
MDVGVSCSHWTAKGPKATISDVAVTVYSVHSDAKLDVIGILFGRVKLRLRDGTY